MYEKGQGVLQDYVKAHAWLNLAASGIVLPSALKSQEKAAKRRDRIAALMTSEQVETNDGVGPV